MTQRSLAKLIIGGVLVWGAILAVGAYRLNHNPARFVVVLGCVLLFLAAFIAVFRFSRRRLDEKAELERSAEDDAESTSLEL